MKRIMLGMAMMAAGLATAYATPACLEGPIPVMGSTVFTCGGLTFGDFSLIAGPTQELPLRILGAEAWDGWVTVTFSPGQWRRNSNGGDSVWPTDLDFSFTVFGLPVDAVQLFVSGRGSSVGQAVCGAPLTGSEELGCGGTTLAQMQVVTPPSGPDRAGAGFSPVRELQVVADIEVQRKGDLFRFSEGFQTVAEPVTAGTIGAGLLLVGWAYRKTRRS